MMYWCLAGYAREGCTKICPGDLARRRDCRDYSDRRKPVTVEGLLSL